MNTIDYGSIAITLPLCDLIYELRSMARKLYIIEICKRFDIDIGLTTEDILGGAIVINSGSITKIFDTIEKIKNNK